MKIKITSLLLIMMLLVVLAPGVFADGSSLNEFKVIVNDLSEAGSGTARDVAVAKGGRYALVLLSNTPSTVVKIDLLTKEVIS